MSLRGLFVVPASRRSNRARSTRSAYEVLEPGTCRITHVFRFDHD